MESSGDAAAINGFRPEQVAEHYASANLSWNDDNGNEVSFSGNYIGSRFEDDVNALSLSDSIKVDGSAHYVISENLSLNARVENIFDAQIEAAISSSAIIERAQPRTIIIGLKLKL